jgi:hypothetical protein
VRCCSFCTQQKTNFNHSRPRFRPR